MLMEVDPRHVHAYWEVTAEDRALAAHRLGGEAPPVRWVLRFYGGAPNEPDPIGHGLQFDVDVNLAPGSWYVTLPAPGRSYRADLGPVGSDGRFVPACSSNTVHAPRSEASPHYAPRWIRVSGAAVRHASEPQPEPPSATEDSGARTRASGHPGPRRRDASFRRPSAGAPGARPDVGPEQQADAGWNDSGEGWPGPETPAFEDISSFELGFRAEAPLEDESQRSK